MFLELTNSSNLSLDLSCLELGLVWYGPSWSVAEVYQHSAWRVHHGLYRDCNSVGLQTHFG
jgi:hypothetical protein